METIVLEVDAAIAQAYNAANEEDRQKLQALVTAFFKPVIKSRTLTEIIEEMRNQAAQNGLTQEFLDNILAAKD